MMPDGKGGFLQIVDDGTPDGIFHVSTIVVQQQPDVQPAKTSAIPEKLADAAGNSLLTGSVDLAPLQDAPFLVGSAAGNAVSSSGQQAAAGSAEPESRKSSTKHNLAEGSAGDAVSSSGVQDAAGQAVAAGSAEPQSRNSSTKDNLGEELSLAHLAAGSYQKGDSRQATSTVSGLGDETSTSLNSALPASAVRDSSTADGREESSRSAASFAFTRDKTVFGIMTDPAWYALLLPCQWHCHPLLAHLCVDDTD
jgi:hypothetical protein